MKFSFLHKITFAALSASLIVACGDDNSSSSKSESEKKENDKEEIFDSFESVKDLPACSDSLNGVVYKVGNDHYSCFNEEWEKINVFAKSVCNIQECSDKNDGEFAYSKLNTTMYKCVVDQWVDQNAKGFVENDYVECYMDALVQKAVDKVSQLPDCGKDDNHSISKVKDDFYVCLSKEWSKLADQVVSVSDLPECGKDESTVFVLGKMKAYVCKDGDWSCDGKILPKIVRDTIQVLDSAAANESAKVRGICLPSVANAEKGEEVTWKFINLGGAPYTYVWNINGELSDEVEPKASYTASGIVSASLVLNEGFKSESDEIVCSNLQIIATSVTGCECSASRSGTIELSDNSMDSVTWTISGCSGADPFIYKWSVGGYGETKTITEYNRASYSPKVTVTNADGASMSVTCPSANFTKSYSASCDLSVEEGYLYVQANFSNLPESRYMTLYGPDDYSQEVYVDNYSNRYNRWKIQEFNYVLNSSSSEEVVESSSSEETIESSSSEEIVESSSSEEIAESSSSEEIIESSSSEEVVESSSSEEIIESSSSEEIIESSSSIPYIPYDPKPILVDDGEYSYYVYNDISDLEFNYYLVDGSDTVCHATTISCGPATAVVSKNEDVTWSISSLVDYTPASYQWNFSDGSKSTDANPVISPKNAGVVRASVTLDKGLKTETTVQCASLNVERDPISYCSCGAPELVSSSDDVVNGPVSYKWSVGGCISNSPLSYDWSGFKMDSETSATGTFNSKGSYGTSVIVSNTDGVFVDVRCQSVFVKDSRSPVEEITYGNSFSKMLKPGEYLLKECGGRVPNSLRLTSESGGCADVVKSEYERVDTHEYEQCDAYFMSVNAPIYIKVPKGMLVSIDYCY